MKGKMKKILASIIVIIMLLINCSQVASYAVTFYAYRTRSDGKQYFYAENKPVLDYEMNSPTNYLNDYYCLRSGAPIGENNEQSESGYNSYNILGKTATEVESATGISLKSEVNYNSTYKITNEGGKGKERSLDALKFIVKNMYVVSSDMTDTERLWMKDQLNTLIRRYYPNYTDIDIKLQFPDSSYDEFIGTIQQFAIWKFVERDSNSIYPENPITGPDSLKTMYQYNANNGEKKSLTDIQCKAGFAIYGALCSAAIDFAQNGNLEFNDPESKNNKFELNAGTLEIEPVSENESTNTYIYKTKTIKIDSYNNVDNLMIKSFASNSITVQNYKIMNASTNSEIENNFSNLSNKNGFYIQFTTNKKLSTNTFYLTYGGTFKPTISSYSAKIFYKADRQPLLEVTKKLEKQKISGNRTYSYNLKYKFDLSLTKEIVDVYRYNQSSQKYDNIYNSNDNNNKRLKSINPDTIETTSSAEYNMTKTPVEVTLGDIIRYKITIYNEGDKQGVIKQIKDYLPDGLEYVSVKDATEEPEFAKYNYRNEKGNTVKVDYTDPKIIKYTFGTGSNLDTTGIKIAPTLAEGGDILDDDKIIYVECRVKNNTKEGDILRNIAVISEYGYIDEFGTYINSTVNNRNNGRIIDIDSEQNNLTTYEDLNNAIDEAISNSISDNLIVNNNLALVDKNKCVAQDDEDFEQVMVRGFDLALRKFITNIDQETFNRSPIIDSTTINSFKRSATTAKYKQSKNALTVKQGSSVIYTIRIFNEGFIDGYAWQIKDYLPEYLKLKEGSSINTTNGWTQESSNNGITVVKTDKLKNTLIKAGKYAEGFEKITKLSSQNTSDLPEADRFFADVQIECEVTNNPTNGTIITNMAEISSYGYKEVNAISTKGEISTNTRIVTTADNKVDIDSKTSPNLLGDLEINTYEQNGSGYRKFEREEGPSTNFIRKTEPNYYIGLEDDDDFENLKVANDLFDLALRKFIVKRNGNDVTPSREPIINNDSINALKNEGTAIYYHTKDPITVQNGDIVTYKIRIFNEGFKKGTVKELVDYLPQGIELKEEGANGWYTAGENSDGSKIIKREIEFDVNASEGEIGYRNYVENNGSVIGRAEFWTDVEVECKVTSVTDGNVLTNVAEISKYGYTENNQYVSANQENVDIDSEENNVFTKDEKISNIDKYYENRRYARNREDYFGEQDDDDFESIVVSARYERKLTINKVDGNGTSLSGAEFLSARGEISSEIMQILSAENYNTVDASTANELKRGLRSLTNNDSAIDVINGSKTYNEENLLAKTDYFYVIKEYASAEGYNNILQDYVIVVFSSFNENGELGLKTSNTNINTRFPNGIVILKENDDGTYSVVNTDDELYGKINVALNTTGEVPEISVTVPNPKIEGAYSFKIKKVEKIDETTYKTIKGEDEGLKFNYKRTEYITGESEPRRIVSKTLNIKNDGYGIYSFIRINGEGTDTIVFSEKENNSNRYIELNGEITLNITKSVENGNYYVQKIEFDGGTGTDTEAKISATLKDGTPIEVTATLDKDKNSITVTVENKKISGEYNLQIEKVDKVDNTKKLQGVTFKVTDKNGVETTTAATGENGIVSVLDNPQEIKEDEEIDWYEIAEESLGNNAYIKLDKTIRVYVEKKIDGNKYTVKRFSLEAINRENEDEGVHENDDVILSMNNEGLITIQIKNEPITGQYALKLKKIDSVTEEPIEGVKFSATKNGVDQTLYPSAGTNSIGRVQVGATEKITAESVNVIDEFTITEINLNGKPYIKLKGYDDQPNNNQLKVYVRKEIVGNKYKATKISFENINENNQGSTSVTKNVRLEDDSEVTVKAFIYGNVVYVVIPNAPINGKYGIELLKTKEDKQTSLQGVKFTVTKEGNTNKIVDELPTDEDGKITIVQRGTEITQETLGKDVYTITENSTIDGYLKISNSINLWVTKEQDGNKYKVTSASFDENDSTKNETDVEFQGITQKLKAQAKIENINGVDVVKVTIPNKEILGSYGLEILKIGKNSAPLKNVKFTVEEGENENKETIIDQEKTGNDGKITVFTKAERETTKPIKANNAGSIDVFTITENETTTGYNLIGEPIKIYVKKGLNQAGTAYVAKSASFSEDDEEDTSLTLDNGIEVTLALDTNTGIVTLTIPNDEIQGSYGLEIVKKGKGGANLAGVEFEVYEGTGTNSIIAPNTTTNTEGKITVFTARPINASSVEIVDTFRVKEVETVSGYIKLPEELTIYVKKGLNEAKAAYELKSASFSQTKDDETMLKDDEGKTIANITLNKTTGLVILTIPNDEIQGSYGLEIVKKGKGGANLAGVEFEVYEGTGTTSIIAPNSKTGTDGKLTVFTERPIDARSVEIVDTFKVKEVATVSGYIKLPEELTIYVKKGLNEAKAAYELKSASFSKTKDDETTLKDEKGKTIANITLNKTTGLVTLTIPNDEIQGSYGLEIIKTGKDSTKLKGVEFEVYEGSRTTSIIEPNSKTNEEGKITVFTKETRLINSENVEVVDIFKVKEVKSADGYIELPQEITIYVKKGLNEAGTAYEVKSASFSQTKDDETTLKDETGKIIANIDLDEDIVTLTIPNDEIQGSYGLEIVKIDRNQKPIRNVEFEITEENADNTNKNYQTDIDGKIVVFTNSTRKITLADVGIQDVFTIKEVRVDEKYIALENPEKIYITKGLNDDKTAYVVRAASFDSKDASKTTKDITLANGKVVTLSLSISKAEDENIRVVTLTIPNYKVEGKYSLELVKLDQKDGVSALSGVTFNIKTMKDEEEVTLYDVDGKEINTKGLTTNKDGKIIISNVNITEGANYKFEITETGVPQGYVMLKDKIILSFKTKVDNETKNYVVSDATINGMAELDSTNNKLTVRLQNGQFDLALRKYISKVTVNSGTDEEKTVQVPNRVPVFKVDSNGNYVYEHSKDTVLLASQNVVEYTIRIYNEGSISGYAKEIKDDIPEGLEFLPDDSTNKKYGWKLLDEKGNEVKEVNKAKYIVTNYLSKEQEKTSGDNLLKAFNLKQYKEGTINGPDYKEVKVAFKVAMPNTDSRIVENKAQISDDSDKDGNEITDKDSTPDKWIDGEDDQDTEKIKVQYFDLSLRKWVSKAIVIEDGKETTTETGHKAEDDPEEIVKVDLKDSKISNVLVKFEYKIRIKNEGEISGYAKEISDYIPEGLKFDAADNPEWKEVEGKIVTEQIKDTILAPGETKEVSVILTWINRKDNLGLKQNVAEISKDYNVYGTPDIDSTPNNKVPGEDDIDDAPVMLTVKTGEAVTFVGLSIVVLAMLSTGIILIKKYVIK